MRLGAKRWAEHLAAAVEEGIPLSRYAKRHGLSQKALYHWKKKLKMRQEVVEPKQENKFVALRVAKTADEKPVCSHLILSCGIRLEISGLPSPTWLVALGRASQGGADASGL
jgi:hypothetical protein